jgi:hypothetical protein
MPPTGVTIIEQEAKEMANESDIIDELNLQRSEFEEDALELQRLLACYQVASPDDKKVVWAVLNKYAPFVTL